MLINSLTNKLKTLYKYMIIHLNMLKMILFNKILLDKYYLLLFQIYNLKKTL